MEKKAKLQKSSVEKDDKMKSMAKNPKRTKKELLVEKDDRGENLNPSGQNDYPGLKSTK